MNTDLDTSVHQDKEASVASQSVQGSSLDCTEGNKLIAEFMGCNILWIDTFTGKRIEVVDFPTYRVLVSCLDDSELCKYHTSWDWLMPVVEKIEGLGYMVEMNKERCIIWTGIGGKTFQIPALKDKREATWQAVVEFIKWYNEHRVNYR